MTAHHPAIIQGTVDSAASVSIDLYACHPRLVIGWLKKSSSTPTREDFLHSTIPSFCSHRRPFLLGLMLAFHEDLPASNCQRGERKASLTAAYQERQHPSKPIHHPTGKRSQEAC